MSTFGLANTVPLADFSADPEDQIYKYLGTNWTIVTPTHIDKQNLFLTTNPADMRNIPDPGNRPVWIWVRHFQLDSGRNLFGSTIGTKGLIAHQHIFDVNLLTTRLQYGLAFPDLGQLSREVERLTYQYQEFQIEGIQQFNTFRMLPIEEASATWGEAYAGTYRVTCQITAQYHKYSTV